MKTLLAKLMIALLATALLSLVTVILITRVNLRSGFVEFLERQEMRQLNTLVPVFAEIYQRNESWVPLVGNDQLLGRLLATGRIPADHQQRRFPRPAREQGSGRNGAETGDARRRQNADRAMGRTNNLRRPPDRLQFRDRLFVLDQDLQPVVGAVMKEPDAVRVPIIVTGETVGWIGFEPMGELLTPEAGIFLSEQRRSAWVSALIASALAVILAFLLARHFSRPISRLAATVRQLTDGDFGARTEAVTADEIGLLAKDVNSLAVRLESNEQARRRWMAEIAHELRTPIAILKGELEAVRDGVRAHDSQSLVSLGEEVEHLAGLVDDLQMLALGDSGALRFNMQAVDLSALACAEAEIFRPRFEDADLTMDLRVTAGAMIQGDLMRLRQLLRNLLANSLRYTHPGGQVELGLTFDNHMVTMWLDDSAPGVEPHHMARLFDRFYRVEESRNRAAGGSGLGLAICQNIIAGHNGTITAQNSRMGGVSIRISLPANGGSD